MGVNGSRIVRWCEGTCGIAASVAIVLPLDPLLLHQQNDGNAVALCTLAAGQTKLLCGLTQETDGREDEEPDRRPPHAADRRATGAMVGADFRQTRL